MKEIERIEDQLKRAFEGKAWHGPSLKKLLTDVTAEMASTRPLANAHSIWEIVLHIAAWEEAVRRRLEGERIELSTQEDWPPIKETSEAGWKNALAALENGHKELQETVARLTDSQLAEMVVGWGYSVYIILHGVIQHNLYHAGQIALLKKAWSQSRVS